MALTIPQLQSNLDAINQALGNPTLKVRFPDGREVTYRSVDERRKARHCDVLRRRVRDQTSTMSVQCSPFPANLASKHEFPQILPPIAHPGFDVGGEHHGELPTRITRGRAVSQQRPDDTGDHTKNRAQGKFANSGRLYRCICGQRLPECNVDQSTRRV